MWSPTTLNTIETAISVLQNATSEQAELCFSQLTFNSDMEAFRECILGGSQVNYNVGTFSPESYKTFTVFMKNPLLVVENVSQNPHFDSFNQYCKQMVLHGRIRRGVNPHLDAILDLYTIYHV